MFLSALSLVELENGAARSAKQGKAAGKAWRDWIDDQLLPAFEGRILPSILRVVGPGHRLGPTTTRVRCPPRRRPNLGRPLRATPRRAVPETGHGRGGER